jgi:hypothetical protein
MKKIIYIILVFVLYQLDYANAHQCRDVYSEKNISGNEFELTEILNRKENPFDVVRKLRSQNPSISDNILDDLSSRLESENVIRIEKLGGGVNVSYKITFESGLQAAYKPVNSDRPNQPIREVVAYRLSKLFGLDIVPPTVMRKISGLAVPRKLQDVIGSVQLFINTAKPLNKGKSSNGSKILIRNESEFQVEDYLSGRRLRVFDWLINNHDRGSNAGNYLISDLDGYVIGIDHSVSFVGHDKQARADKVPFYKEKYLDDPEYYFKYKSVPKEKIKLALDGLNPVRINEFFERFDKLILDFKKVIDSTTP